jgi:hypothetical protein
MPAMYWLLILVINFLEELMKVLLSFNICDAIIKDLESTHISI